MVLSRLVFLIIKRKHRLLWAHGKETYKSTRDTDNEDDGDGD